MKAQLKSITSISSRSEDDCSKLIELLHNANWRVRYESLKALESYWSLSVNQAAIDMLNDCNAVVRTQAVEIVGRRTLRDGFDKVLNLMASDESDIVRGAAADALSEFQTDSSIDCLHERRGKEIVPFVQVAILNALTWTESFNYLPDLLNFLHHPDETARIRVVNRIPDLGEGTSCSFFIHLLKVHRSWENSPEVLASIDKVVQELTNFQQANQEAS